MFEDDDNSSDNRPFDPEEKVKAKADEFRMHAELAAVFEGIRKSAASLDIKMDTDLARSCQQAIGKLERLRVTDTPLLPPDAYEAARALLDIPTTNPLTENDYHVSRRPGETLIFRWLNGESVDSFYARLQANLDAALLHFREDERQANAWRQDQKIDAYLEKLDALKIDMAERYLRPLLKEHGLFALSTQAADEIDISHLCDLIMGIPAAEVVGARSAPQNDSEAERAWYFKLYSLRGWSQGTERLCFFAYLQKTSDPAD